MVQSDTVVGIAGTVILLGVMVGVFVYEYNNVETDGTETPPPALASINGTLDGSLSPQGPSEQVHEVSLAQVAGLANITIRYADPDPVGLPVVPLPGLTLRLENDDGVVAEGERNVEGDEVTLRILHEGQMEPGQYRIVVGQEQGSLGADYTGTYAFHYA